MTTELIHDRGRGPELIGTRITVYDLLPHFLDPTATETYVCQLYKLTPDQVAAARAYVLNHPTTVLAKHLEIEARLAIGNPPEVIERARQTRSLLARFEDYQTRRREAEAEELAAEAANGSNSHDFPSFREWMKEQAAQQGKGA